MRAWAGRVVIAAGLVANAIVVPHPLGLAIAQVLVAAVVLTGWGGAAVLAVSAVLLIPAPVAELRRGLSHAPLACPCQAASGRAGWWPVLGATADVALIALTVALARVRHRSPSGPGGRKRLSPS
jgi:hypothetical protein